MNTADAASRMSAISPPENVLEVKGEVDPARQTTTLRLQDGRMIRIATADLLLARVDRFEAEEAAAWTLPEGAAGDREEVVLPLIEEQLTVTKRVVPTGRVLLHRSVQEHQVTLDEPLDVRTYEIERVVLNQIVERYPGVQVEGNVTIYPLVEEQLVLTKQLVLTGELRVICRETQVRDQQVVTLRR